MLDLQLPWWEFLARAAIVYVALLILVRISGKRTVGQFTPFDLVLVIMLGEAVSNSLIGGDDSLVGGLLVASALIAFNFTLGHLTARSRALDRWVEGRPVLIARDGEIFWEELKRQKLTEADFRQAMRKQQCLHDRDIRFALLEPGGEIVVIGRKAEESNG